ncbi:hypothetical protein [Sphingomonas sp.]|uniref:hypothetical protein n=1 Tax=Sphingomonas sp. TaxID=28214 RepID=UPI0025CC2A15|nr:hypothetical protein [Sphingomonas sp.]
MTGDRSSSARERTALQLKAITNALRTAYPVEPTRSFNSDIADLLAALDRPDDRRKR